MGHALVLPDAKGTVKMSTPAIGVLTLAFYSSSIDASTGHQNIMYDREDTLTTDPTRILAFDLAIVENGSLV